MDMGFEWGSRRWLASHLVSVPAVLFVERLPDVVRGVRDDCLPPERVVWAALHTVESQGKAA